MKATAIKLSKDGKLAEQVSVADKGFQFPSENVVVSDKEVQVSSKIKVSDKGIQISFKDDGT